MAGNRRTAFTIIEMFVVLMIIGILLMLIFPALQRFREAANRAQCLNNLKQMALACQAHHDAHDHFPSAGWGWFWLGCPHRGNGPEQPGGWAYNILPFIERTDLRKLGYGKSDSALLDDMKVLVTTPVGLFHCPTRRSPQLYPNFGNYRSADANKVMQTFTPPKVVRCDYAGNAGSQVANEVFAGPNSVAEGDTPSWWPSGPSPYNGVFFLRSKVTRDDITRGASNVYLIGERYLNPNHYYTGTFGADNETIYAGFNNDICRTTFYPPRQDSPGYDSTFAYGSAHHGGFHMAKADGSVQFIDYSISPDVHAVAGNRFID